MDHNLLGKVLATILTAAIDAGAVSTDPSGVLTQPDQVAKIASGFLNIWLSHPASGKVPSLAKGV